MEATLMRKFRNAMLVLALALTFAIPATQGLVSAQEGEHKTSVVVGDRIYCAGFISDTKINYDVRIIGNEKENESALMVRGAHVFMNKGKGDGIQVGDVYQVIRPRGPFYHPFKNARTRFPSFAKRGELLGYFTEEVGFAKVIGLQDKTSTLEVVESCTEFRLGDALIKYEKPQPPELKPYAKLDPLALPNGKTVGQIVTARSAREFLSVSDVVILDVGQKAGVKVGDYFTIFRENGSEAVKKFRDDEVAYKNGEGNSERYRGNGLSINHPSVQKEKIRKQYPNKVLPRTLVGELVISRVEGNTAVAIITRTHNGEVYVGDSVELE